MATVVIHHQRIMDAFLLAWDDTMFWLQRQFIQEFTENKWAWPSGQSPRDIIDTTMLRGATMSPQQARLTDTMYMWGWELEYALAVHNGATFRAGPNAGRTLPARPWTALPLQKLPQAFNGFARRRMQGL